MKRKLYWLLPLLFLCVPSAWGQEVQEDQTQPRPLTGWFTSGGVRLTYEGQGENSSLGIGLSAGFGKNLKGQPLALGVQFDYGWNREKGDAAPQPRDVHTVRARPFLRTYVFSRGSFGASFDTSVPLAMRIGAAGAESVTAGVSVSPTAVYFVSRRVTVFMTLSLFELSYSCTVPLHNRGQSGAQHRFVAGFLNMGMSGAVMGVTWNL